LSEQPLQESTPKPSAEIRKPLFGTKIYAILATLGWLTLFTPFVMLRACGVQQTYWGIDWIALQYGEESEHVSHGETLKKGSVSPSISLEATLEKLQAEQEEKSKEEIEKLLKELYREAPFYLRLLLSVDPVPEASYLLLVLTVGLAWLQWYRPVGWLCVAGLILCLHTILNIYGHHHLFAHQAFPFGVVEIEPGWGLFALAGLWGAFYALNLLQPGQLRQPEGWSPKILGPAFSLVVVGLVLLGRGTFLTSKAQPPLKEAGVQTSPLDASRKTGRRELEEEQEKVLRKIVDAEPVATKGIEREDKPAETTVKLDKQITMQVGRRKRVVTFSAMKLAKTRKNSSGQLYHAKPGYKLVTIEVSSQNIGKERDMLCSQSYKIEVDKEYIYDGGGSIKVGLLPEETSSDELVFEILESTAPVKLDAYLNYCDTRTNYEFTVNLRGEK
jgi:hypothetical protein